jgi:uncharacterized cupin superfamily protein
MPDAAALAQLLIRNFHDAQLQRRVREPLYDCRTARLGTGTAARKLGCTVVELAPGKRAVPYHLHHAEEEMFVVLEGTGSARVAGEMLPLKAGDVLFTPAGKDFPHQIVNTSDAPLKYLAISNRADVEICEYPDSDKFLADAQPGGRDDFGVIQRRGGGLDYWDGEP